MLRLGMLSVFALVLTVLGQLSFQADDNTFAVFREKTYYFSTSFKLNWFKAMEFCRTRGMFLVSVRNPQEREAVIEYLNSTGYTTTHNIVMIWLSANDLGEEGEFFWSSTGENLAYSNWSPGEPNNAKSDDCTSENCVAMEYWKYRGGYNYTFDDRCCNYEYHFICETLSE